MANSIHRINSSLSDANFKLSCDRVLSKLVPADTSLINLILSYNNPDQAEIVLPDGRIFVWYFAIGSMLNPISLYLRDLTSLMSYPAACLNHTLVFRGSNGIADIEAGSDLEFDGVVHLFSNEHMAHLDDIEIFYKRIEINCIDYQGQSHTVYAYKMNMNDQPITRPHERYLDIIIKGCEYFKVRPEYINRLRNDQSVIPRKQPDSFQSFTDFPPDAYYTLDDLQKHNGDDPSLPVWTCINGKILEHIGLPPTDHPDYGFQKNFQTFVKKKLGGREVTMLMARTLYEPMYKLPLNDEEICDEHRARIEDHYYNTLGSSQNKAYWKSIGRLR